MPEYHELGSPYNHPNFPHPRLIKPMLGPYALLDYCSFDELSYDLDSEFSDLPDELPNNVQRQLLKDPSYIRHLRLAYERFYLQGSYKSNDLAEHLQGVVNFHQGDVDNQEEDERVQYERSYRLLKAYQFALEEDPQGMDPDGNKREIIKDFLNNPPPFEKNEEHTDNLALALEQAQAIHADYNSDPNAWVVRRN